MESLDKFGTELRQFSQLMTFTSMAVLSIEDQNLGSSLNSSPVQVQVPWQFSYINLPVVLTKAVLSINVLYQYGRTAMVLVLGQVMN